VTVIRRPILALAAAVLWTVAPWSHAASPAVPTIAVAPGAAVDGFELDGSLQPVRQSTVAAQVGGSVMQLLVKAGDRVASGQVIARIDERDAQAGLARSDAAVAQAEAERANARLHAERTRSLRQQNFVSQAALDVAETQLKAAEAAVQQAQAGRTQAAVARGYTAVTAPFAGLVRETHLEAGDLAAPGRPIATIYAPGALRAVVQVPSSRMALARGAKRVEILLPGAEGWVAPVKVTPLPAADAVSQTVEWRLDLPADLSTAHLPGATVRVRFAGAEPSATTRGAAAVPTLPASAVLRRGELTAVYVAEGDRFVLRAVRTGTPVGDRVPVLAGLKGGERVATDPVRAGLAGGTPAP
jgi:RND family efflux transporter MFP subunit